MKGECVSLVVVSTASVAVEGPRVAAEASSLSDGYGGRRQGRGRRSLDDYDESEPEELTRVFVALFDYDPMSMSPNPDAADEELPFKEGQIIKVGGVILRCTESIFLFPGSSER